MKFAMLLIIGAGVFFASSVQGERIANGKVGKPTRILMPTSAERAARARLRTFERRMSFLLLVAAVVVSFTILART
jgi:hypothetical protein